MDTETFFERLELVGSPDVVGLAVLLAFCTALLSDPVHEDGGTGFGDKDGVGDLDGSTEDQLDPDVPSPGEELFDETTHDGSEDRAADRGEDDECDGVLLVVTNTVNMEIE